jgi:uncharacterized protein (DUF488 family)
MVVFTIGHGTRSLDDFTALLTAARIGRLVDVRRHPGSRRNPQFSSAVLQSGLHRAGIGYDFRGDELGGRRSSTTTDSRHLAWRVAAFRNYADYMDTPDFFVALERLIQDVRTQRICIMCAETLWWRCHRRLIADALVIQGHEVVHLIGPGQSQVHPLHEAARADDRGMPVYDAGRLPL